MTSPPQVAFRRGFCSLALVACVTTFTPQPAAARGGSEDACVRWTQKRLVIGADLQSRRFMLEPAGDLELMPVFRVAEGRSVFHRPFSLFLDVGGKVSVFLSSAPRTCLLARDESSQALKIPVFFVSRPGGSLDELKDNADDLAFAPSSPLDVGGDFSDVNFHLRRGGSRFDVIRPFFLCGLTGLLVCQQSCPEDSDTLAASLVNEIVRGESFPPSGRDEANAPSARRLSQLPAPPALKPRPAPRFTQAPSSPPEPLEPAPMPSPRVRSSENAAPPERVESCPSCPPSTQPAPQRQEGAPSFAPQTQPSQTAPLRPKVEAAPPSPQTQPSKNETLPPKSEAAPAAPSQAQPPESAPPPPRGEAPPPAASKAQPSESTAPPSKTPQAESAPPPKTPESAPPPAPSPPPIQHIVLAFERKNGEAMPAADVVQAEGSLNIEGAPLQAASEGLTADLPAEAAKRLADNAYLKKLLKRHQLVTVRKEPERLVLVVDPLYVRAEDLKIEIHDAAAEPVHGCELALDVSADRRLGEGWSKLGEKDRLHGLEFAGTDGQYALNLPTDIEPNELLISTAEPGNVARLSSTGSTCQLEARQWITAEELRTGKPIVRSLKGAGQTLIAVLSTDGSFAGSVGGVAAAEGFWSDALRLVNVVSTAAWEKKVLARAQAPGVSPETGKLQMEAQGGALAGDGSRGAVLKALSKGSQSADGPYSIFQMQPIERYLLDIALKLIRQDASITPQYSVKQEALILVTGSVKDYGSYFCQHSVRRDKSPWSNPQWFRQARKIFALEVWTQGAADDMQKGSRIKAAQNAPEGVYICNIPAPEGDKIALYGIVPKVVSDSNARARVFSYLTGQANSFLKP